MRRSVIRGFLVVLLIALAFIAGHISADQPAMQAALKNLRQARADLNRATADKGGHRERALRLVDEAIEEVQHGMTYDRHH